MTILSAASVDRRTLIAGTALLAGSAAFPAGQAAASPSLSPGITLFDPALSRAAALAGEAAAGGRLIGIRGDRIRFWHALERSSAPIAGFTNWSDYVVLRGLAAEAGLRVRRETDLSTSVRGTLVAWLVA